MRSFASKITTPVRAATLCQRPIILTPSPASARSLGDIEVKVLSTESHLSCEMLQVTQNFMMVFSLIEREHRLCSPAWRGARQASKSNPLLGRRPRYAPRIEQPQHLLGVPHHANTAT